MLQALEMAWGVLNLPALLAADLLSLLTAACAASLFIHVCADWKMVEIR
jgi:hypothetical protein